jgi:CRISPR-associated protein Csb1
MLQVNFAGDGRDSILAEIGRITALEAPHRLFDAVFRDSVDNGTPFRQTEVGARLGSAKAVNATPVFELCPTALLFGFWDSTGPRGGLGAKLQRALVSEIVGYQTAVGKRPASRIDPLQIEDNLDIYAREGGGWTFDEALARREGDQPVKLKPSKIIHGNITPSLRHEDKKTKEYVLNHGGVTLAYATQHTVLSLAALRRLRFPVKNEAKPEVDVAGRTVLAALGLVAICLVTEDGYDLRSRCLLDGRPGAFELVGRGEAKPYELDSDAAIQVLTEAVEEAERLGLPWPAAPVTLQPSADLSRLVVESRRKSMATSAGA